MRRAVLSLGLALAALTPARADVKLAPIFGDHMVLQRDAPVPVWGTAAPGEEVTVTFLKQKMTATAGRDGRWSVTLDRLAAGGPHVLTAAGKNALKLTDVLVGEVWLCSGQSNMAWRLKQSENAQKESQAADLPKVRLNAGTGAAWTACTPATALNFSACAYYFGRDLHKALGVPVGLINRSVGGTSARQWTAVEVMKAEPGLKPYIGSILKDGQAKPAKGRPRVPGGLYEAHIKPVVPFAIRGVIWYQGEADATRPDEYAVLFPTLIRSWRKAWGQGDFPFLYVQLAPIDGKRSWERIREVQLQSLAVPKTAMAVIIDGDVGIHPVKKQLPGTRLALAARALAYGENVVHSGPVYKSMKVDGGKAVLTFAHTGGGLAFRGGKAAGFQVLDAEGHSAPAEAKIEGDTVVVWSPEIKAPAAVRYGWANAPTCTLINKEGLPASPFRTDAGAKPKGE